MGNTKIINVLKSDSFEDILNEFKQAEAKEVIFILPKNSKMARNESHFVTLASEMQSSQKKITLMTSDESVQSYAPKYGFRLLANPGQDDDQPQKTEEEIIDKDLLPEISPALEQAEESHLNANPA